MTAFTASRSPPTMIDNRASRAPTSPPDTGASMLWIFFDLATAYISRARLGSVVVMSTRMLPFFAPERTPRSPRMTSRTSGGKPTIVNTTSDASATALGESAHAAPLASNAPALSLPRVWTVMPYPFAMRCPHIGPPMTPVPIHPIRVSPGSTVSITIPLLSPGQDPGGRSA